MKKKLILILLTLTSLLCVTNLYSGPDKVDWKNPLFKNLTSLKIFYIDFETKVFGVTTSATFGNSDFSKTDSFISENQEKNLSGQLYFGVAPSDSTTKKKTSAIITIKAIDSNKAVYTLTEDWDYSNKVDGGKNSIWFKVKEIPSGSPSCITLFFDGGNNRFKLYAVFQDKTSGEANPAEYGIGLFMQYTKGKHSVLSL